MANEKKRALYNMLNKGLKENLQQGYNQTVEDLQTNPSLGMIRDTLNGDTLEGRTRAEKQALYNVLNKGVGENLQQGYNQTVQDVRSNPTLGMITDSVGNTIRDTAINAVGDIPYSGRGAMNTLQNMAIDSVMNVGGPGAAIVLPYVKGSAETTGIEPTMNLPATPPGPDFNPLGATTQMFTNFADDLQTKGMVESEAGNQVFSPSQFVVEGVKTLGGMLPNSTGLEGMVNPNIKSPTAMAERATLGGFDVTTAGGTPTQKKQGGAGMSGAGGNLSGLADYAENAANNILGTKPATALPSLGSVDITKKPGIDPTNAPGLGVDGNTMTYRSPTGGKATITGPGVGSMNFDKARIDAGVPTIGDWAGQEAKNSIHQQGIARLRAGLPYDAKEAAVVQNQMNAARARDIADNNFGIAQRQQTEQASRIAQDLKNEASWMTRGSNVGSRQRKEAAELYAAAAGIESGTLKEGMQNRNVRELGLGEIDQRSQDSQRDYDAALAGQQITAQDAWLKNMLAQGNADRNYGLEKEKLGTERDKAGLTMQDKQAENLNRAQKLRLEAADKVTGIWANSNITNPQDKRRMAVGLYQQSGMSPKEAQFEAIQLDPEARAAIEAKDWNLMSRMYDADVVDAVRTQLEKRQLGYPQK